MLQFFALRIARAMLTIALVVTFAFVVLRLSGDPALIIMGPEAPPEVIAAEIARPDKGHFNVIHADTGFKADFYLAGRDELNAWAFRNSRKMEYRGEPMIIAPPEYVIVRKLEYFREGRSEKHLRDIRAMLAVSGEQLDRAALDEWVKRQDVESEWRLVS